MFPGDTLPYFLYAFGIILREGMEAMLVVIALAAGVRSCGSDEHTRDVYTGAGAALVASIALAWAANHLIADNTSDALEGIFQFFAAGTLFYVSSWLTSKSQADKWNKFIAEKLANACKSAIPSLALGLTAFLAVIREGGETIVFFQALTAGATLPLERHAVMLGLTGGLITLAIVFVVLTRASYRIPVAALFKVTSVLLYALAIVFVGQGVASWQEAGVLGATFIDHVPEIQVLGIFPTVESIGAQAVLLLFAATAWLIPRGINARRAMAMAEQPVTPSAAPPT